MKKITALVMSFFVLLTVCVPALAAEVPGSYDVSKSIQVFQKTFCVGSEEAHIIESAVTQNTTGQEGKYIVGSAFVIYNLDDDTTSYMIPVFYDQKCIGMVHMSRNLEVGVTFTSDTKLYYKIFDLPAGTYILYVTGGVIYAESPNETALLQDLGLSLPSNESLLMIPYEEKLDRFLSQAGDICALSDICAMQNEIIDINLESKNPSTMERPCVEVPSFEGKSCNISDFVSQGPYPLCWAACIATIANFKKGYDLTAISVANKFGVDYTSPTYTGESDEMIRDALNSYGFSYSIQGRLNWSDLKTNINNDDPFILGAITKVGNLNYGHAMTVYGYSCATNDSIDMSDQRYVQYWNPEESDYPQKSSFQYNNSQFVFYGYTYTWTISIAP